MKQLLILASLVVVAFAWNRKTDPGVEEDWKLYKQIFKKEYYGEEEIRRHFYWIEHLRYIENHNRKHDLGLKSFRLGLNQFTDLTNKEFIEHFNGYKQKPRANSPNVFKLTSKLEDLPSKVDWRDKNVVTDVKNQAQCGSCWAFSTTGSVEGQHALKTKKLVSLSEQNLVDCSGDQGNMGCEGGLMDQGFQYIIKNKGIDTEQSYPYEAQDDSCRFKAGSVGATISSFKDVSSGDESALQQAVAQVGPISVAIDASNLSFQFYSDGIYDEESCSTSLLDHGVLAVGYGSENGKDYWLVKNSWDVTWGMNGYIKMSRNKNNQCGIATQASYPVV